MGFCRSPGDLCAQAAVGQKGSNVEAARILEKPTAITRGDDEETGVVYLSIAEPQPAAGVDIGEGVVLRYDTTRREVVGLTLIGLRARLLKSPTTSEGE